MQAPKSPRAFVPAAQASDTRGANAMRVIVDGDDWWYASLDGIAAPAGDDRSSRATAPA